MKAVVIGATGAVGSAVFTGEMMDGQGKLEQVIIDMENLEIEGVPAFAGASTAFCALGTQRGVAGSAAAFRRVDLDYVDKAARAAKAAGVQHFSLLTAQGANSKQWANDLLPFHPLLYIRTKGQAEDAVRAQSFPRMTVFRPGLLLKGQHANMMEKVIGKVVTGIQVADVARCMRLDAEAPGSSGKVISMADMLQTAQSAKH